MGSLPWYFDLRDESRKGWENFPADELVYVSEVLERDMYSSIFVSKNDGGAKAWIEAHLIFSGQRDGHYCAIIELLMGARDSMGNFASCSRIRRVLGVILLMIGKQVSEEGRFFPMVASFQAR